MATRYRLYPTSAQEHELVGHCTHARFVWNLGLEQRNLYRPHLGHTPNYNAQSAQLTEARAANEWLASGSFTVQQQALRDLDQAFRNWWNGTHGRPTWRKRGQREGFRVIRFRPSRTRRLNRRWAEVFVPKIGWVRFRWTRPVGEAKSYRVTLDRSGRWHISFASVPKVIARTSTGAMVGIDRGIAKSITLSHGSTSQTPRMAVSTRAQMRRLQRKMERQQKDSGRRSRTQRTIATIHARDVDRAKNWVETTTTRLVVDHDLIAIEVLPVNTMTRSAKGNLEVPGRNVRQKAGLNREIFAQRWGLFARRLRDKCELADVTFVEVPAVNTSRRCYACGHVAAENRKSQAVFCCVACGHTDNADVNAARNILAAGLAVSARGGWVLSDPPMKREPQLAASAA